MVDNTPLYGGRSFLSTMICNQKDPSTLKSKRGHRPLRVVSYNVYSDAKCLTVRYSTTRKWEKRCITLIEEIRSYDADIICLQEVDHFEDWWRVQLMLLGYDSIFKKRTKEREIHYEGVVIAFKRDLFQLFKSVPINLNDARHLDTGQGSGFNERLVCDDVGLLLLLQPWVPDFIESAVLVGCCQFTSRDGDFDVRFFQAQYFTRQMELANREFHLPVILGCSLYDTPNSPAYHVLRTGRRQMKPRAPSKVKQPTGKGYCRGSARVTWYAPKMGKADPPIHSYRIAWRPGGSLTLGFREQIEVMAGAVVQYGERVNEHGVRKSFVMNELAFNVTGLSSELPFEFIVCAVNDIGAGLWSDPSMPVVMVNPPRNPRQAPLKYLRNEVEVGILREQFAMDSNDWDVEIAINSNPVTAATQLTPRTISGVRDPQVPRCRVLPLSVNPREGWKQNLQGQSDPRVIAEISTIDKVFNTALRINDQEDPLNFQVGITDSPRSKRAILPSDFIDSPVDHMGRPNLAYSRALAEGGFQDDEGDDRSCISDMDMNHNGLEFGPGSDYQKDLDDHADAEEKSIVSSATGTTRDSNGTARSRTVLPRLRTSTKRLGDLERQMLESGVAKEELQKHLWSIEAELQRLKEDNGDVSVGSDDTRRNAIFARNLDGVALNIKDDDSRSGFESKGTEGDESSLGSEEIARRMRIAQQLALENQRAQQVAALKAEEERLRMLNLAALRDPSRLAQRLNDDTLLDGTEAVLYIGRPDPRQLHSLSLRSAYETYSAGGEPLFTQSLPATGNIDGVACSDYIFFSGHSMYAEEVLSLPTLTQLRGDNPMSALSHGDPYWKAPPHFTAVIYNKHEELLRQVNPSGRETLNPSKSQVADAKRILNAALEKSLIAGGRKEKPPPGKGMPDKIIENPPVDVFWGGIWVPNAAYNPLRSHYWLPNDTFVSSHLALGADLCFIEGQVATLWK